MIDTIWQIVLMLVTTAAGWGFGKLQTKRERKQTDLEIINNSIKPLLSSIQELTERNNSIVAMYLEEQTLRLTVQDENKILRKERDDLSEQVSKLSIKVDRLEKTIQKLTK